ncbi:progestin and adipoQ receptor-like protein [Sarcoptes scabiei]|uniref:Progestin and adipoQ receptor-like protein n=1 Tax=Sarcoptes scabiei TaxID=52283 RepID=A0A131ZSX2_SARSC|nr:progestin and adipoQ receptor-like protein [Sarcoptes scabiei]
MTYRTRKRISKESNSKIWSQLILADYLKDCWRKFSALKRNRFKTESKCIDFGLKSKTESLDAMPDYLRFNPWILSGYRSANLTTYGCLCSIVSLHNETINIITHLVPLIYLIFNYSTIFHPKLFDSYLTYCHVIGCYSPWIGSSIYHIFMNHHRGKSIYSRLLQIDMVGIWITQTFGALTTINASLKELSDPIRNRLVIIYLLLSLYALHKGLNASIAWQRPCSFFLLVLIRALCFVVRISTHHHRSMLDLNSSNNLGHIYWYVIGQELWPIIGACIAVLRIPERFFPGRFDLIFNSHNIMHCLVLLGGFHMHIAFLNDIQYFI